MQKHVNLVDLVKSFPTNIFLQNLASIQKRTSPVKFAHLAEKSENGAISNLSTKAPAAPAAASDAEPPAVRAAPAHGRLSAGHAGRAGVCRAEFMTRGGWCMYASANFERLVLKADFCNQILIFSVFSRPTIFLHFLNLWNPIRQQ